MDLREIGRRSIQLTQQMMLWRAFVSTVMNLAEHCLTSRGVGRQFLKEKDTRSRRGTPSLLAVRTHELNTKLLRSLKHFYLPYSSLPQVSTEEQSNNWDIRDSYSRGIVFECSLIPPDLLRMKTEKKTC
jgi:hypothetical protein